MGSELCFSTHFSTKLSPLPYRIFAVSLSDIIPFSHFSNQKNEDFKLTTLQVFKVFILGMTGIFSYNYFFFGGLKIVEAGKASMIIAINPVITAIIAGLFLGEGFNFKKVIGVVIALLGAFTIITDGQPWLIFQVGLDRGELLLFGAVISWTTYTLVGKIILKKLSPLKATAYACFMGTISLFPFAIQNGLREMVIRLNFQDFLNLFYLGFFATVLGFIWFYQGIKEIGAGKAAVFINLVPLFGVLSGAIFLNERLAPTLMIGGAVVLFGVTLVQKSKHVD